MQPDAKPTTLTVHTPPLCPRRWCKSFNRRGGDPAGEGRRRPRRRIYRFTSRIR